MTPPPAKRTTPAAPVTIAGVGLFTAQTATITINPARDNAGIRFRIGDHTIPAHIDYLSDIPVHPAFAALKPRCTSVGDGRATAATIEHLMSALAGLGITDALIAFEPGTGPDHNRAEIPIMDGSAQEFVRVLEAVGIETLPEDAHPVRITAPITVSEGDSSITIEPADSPHYSYRLQYPAGPIPPATAQWDGDRQTYIEGIAPARTFCLEHEARAMRDAGLFEHLSYRDMLVIGADGPIENEYRFPDECARHKLLDLIGDLALVGGPLIARVTAVRSGHALAHRAARAIVDQFKTLRKNIPEPKRS